MPSLHEPGAVAPWPEFAVADLLDRLESCHGRALPRSPSDPLDTLVATILSQHTSDRNSYAAYERLRAALPSWQQVVEAPTQVVADLIRAGGLAHQKAPRIQSVLREVRRREGAFSLAALAELDTAAALSYLTSLAGVGPKSAAIVLCFELGRPVLPVDTHVFRVAWRLGLIDRRIGEARAHTVLGGKVPGALTYRFHVALIRHGRSVCRARRPACDVCAVRGVCVWYPAAGAAQGHATGAPDGE